MSRREVPTPELRCSRCHTELERFWGYCPSCGRRLEWKDTQRETNAECAYCGWIVSDAASFCPWCGRNIQDEDSSDEPLKAPKGFKFHRRYVTGKRRRDEISWNMLTGLLLHELGHSFLYHHWSWTRSGRFRRTFGEVRKAYRVADEHWVDFERRRIATTLTDYVSAYAATHPQEDFAETFRFYVARRGRLRELFSEFGRKRKGVRVYEKFLVLHDYVRSLRGWK